MSILCGTDFSEAAQRAFRVAIQLARKQDAPLQLVYALSTGDELRADPKTEVVRWAERQLERQASIARERGVAITTHLASGAPDDVLIARATEIGAELIVVGALGHRAPGAWQLGSHADRLAQRSHVPVLVVRASEPLEAWLKGERPLRVVLGADLSHSTEVAMAKLEQLRAGSQCEVTAVHLYWPPHEFGRLGLDGVRSYLDPDPEVGKTLTRELTNRLAPVADPGSFRVYVEPHLGRLGDRLAAVASERGADLLVVGTHDRSVLGRVWEGSVARWALHTAQISVLCVPAQPTAAGRPRPVPRMRNVLAATDFSPCGNAAVANAYAIAEPGATVHLVHVVPAAPRPSLSAHDVFAIEQAAGDPRRDEVHASLRALIPDGAQCLTRVHALESDEPAAAICQAAARLDANAVCIGHRGRSNLVSALLGSVAKNVLAHADVPVLLTKPPRE